MANQKNEVKTSKTNVVDSAAKLVAHVLLVLSAAYGLRSALRTIDDAVAIVITVAFVLALTYIAHR